MGDSVFRSVDFWKSAIMTMPDNSFFELVRSVFGAIKTPFNKQQLAKDLEVFLLRGDIQKNISCYIDETDAKIIAAVAMLGDPAPGDMEKFFSDELNYAELHDIIINLEERFILYRFLEEGLYRLALNPVLRPVLEPFTDDRSLLLPSLAAEEETAAPPVLNDLVLAGILAFVAENSLFFKTEGEIRKRVIDAAGTVFPGLEMEPVTGGLRALGLLRAVDDRFVPDYRCFSAFAALSPLERMEYCAAGIYCYRESESPAGISHHLLRGRIRFIAGFIRRFRDYLEGGRLYPPKTLKRSSDILLRETKNDFSGSAFADGVFPPGAVDSGALIGAMEQTGLFTISGKYRRLASFAANDAKTGAPLIAMDSNLSCMVYPEINCGDAFRLAEMLSVREAGQAARFELTRDSAIRAFNRGITADAIIALLTRLAGGRIAETLIWTVKEWEKRYGEVALRRGVVLSLSPERVYLAKTGPLSALIRETLAPGVYLLAEDAETEAMEALRNAGVDIIARRNEAPAELGRSAPFPPLAGKAEKPSTRLKEPGVPSVRRIEAGEKRDDSSPASTLIGGFHSILAQMRFSASERDELAARIDRRLILCEAQLRDASMRYEKLEARGLDYVGKLNIAKQAIALQTPVEVVWPAKKKQGRTDKEERVFGIPKALEKEGGESILVIAPHGMEKPLRIPLGKISLLRRIKKSIFETGSL
jgi:hypothetical protein